MDILNKLPIKKFVILNTDNEEEKGEIVDAILFRHKPDEFQTNSNANPSHYHIEPKTFYWSHDQRPEYYYNFDKPGDPHQWAMRQLLWHLSGKKQISYEHRHRFVEDINEQNNGYEEGDIQIIFIHAGPPDLGPGHANAVGRKPYYMNREVVQAFTFLLQSMGYEEERLP